MRCTVVVAALATGCVQPNTGQKGAESCETYTCPVGTAREEVRSVESWERDVSAGTGPEAGQSGGTGVAFFSVGECSFTCAALTECPAGTWPVITRDCFTCALLDDDGQVIESACDFDDNAATGTGNDDSDDPDDDTPPTRPGWEQVASGAEHTCALYTGGEVSCWGASEPPPDTLYTAIDAGQHGTCGLTMSGTVLCWGVTGTGSGTATERALTEGVPAGGFTHVSVGDTLACALDLGGALTCWGDDPLAQPGPYDSVAAGGGHACALSDLGELDCFGADDRGQVRGAPSGTFDEVSAGALHSCARSDASRSLSCWTLDDDGESSPPPDSWTAVSVGDRFACGIDDDDTVQCWGRNTTGQASPPTGRATSVSAGADHACATLWDGTVACWGDDTHGQSAGPP